MPQQPPATPGTDGWQALAEESMKSWANAGTQLADTVAQTMMAGQTVMGRVIELTSDAWRTMAPQLDGSNDFSKTMEQSASRVRQLMFGLPTSPATAGDMVQLWQLYLQQIQELSQPWLRLMTRDAPAHLGRSFPGQQSELLELSNHYWDAYERTIGRLLGSPSLGYSRELNHLLAEGFDAWQDFVRAGSEYRLLMSEAWMNSLSQTIAELGKRGERGEPVTSVKQLIEIWTDTGDAAFNAVFQSTRYIESQSRLLNSAMALRRKQQEIVDDLLKGSYLPGRGEVDEAYRSIYELRKELREVKRKLAELESRPSTAPPAKKRTVSSARRPKPAARKPRTRMAR